MKKLLPLIFLTLLSCNIFSPSNDDNSTTTNTTKDPLENATPIEVGDTLSIKAYYETYSYYKIIIDEPILLHVTTTGMPALVSSNIHLLDEEGEGILLYDFYGNGQNFDSFFTMTEGEYYFVIYPDYGDSSSEYFEISFLKDAIDTMEYNNTLSYSAPINVGTAYHGTIMPIRDLDYYSFSIDSSRYIRLKVDSLPDALRMNISIYDDGDTAIYSYWNSFEKDSIVLDYELAKGDYHLRIKSNEQYFQSTEPYVFKLSVCTLDTFEENNEIADSKEILIGDTITGNIYPLGDIDCFKFSLKESTSITMFADSVRSDIDFMIDLYDSTETSINSIFGQKGDSVSLTEDLSPGTYYVKLSDRWHDALSDKLYQFFIRKN